MNSLRTYFFNHTNQLIKYRYMLPASSVTYEEKLDDSICFLLSQQRMRYKCPSGGSVSRDSLYVDVGLSNILDSELDRGKIVERSHG